MTATSMTLPASQRLLYVMVTSGWGSIREVDSETWKRSGKWDDVDSEGISTSWLYVNKGYTERVNPVTIKRGEARQRVGNGKKQEWMKEKKENAVINFRVCAAQLRSAQVEVYINSILLLDPSEYGDSFFLTWLSARNVYRLRRQNQIKNTELWKNLI